ncbi:hypothetical protein I9W82_005609 [Candida metapsilosis]|uniref:NADPH-dependent 1-acyldihydroxyacetone phosphate reductase n=1 Tax=Candida metapsilosis TaxID=273372 RepID=A0A8H7ZAV8_9ASCO|nr:hypothetical protein I9W82_005609 [Candida metapsilosis]
MSGKLTRPSKQKYALISGASSGIGYALAKEFSKKGYKVIAASPKAVLHLQDPLVAEYGVISVPCDITNLDDLKRLKDVVFEETGGYLDILYNNAGIAVNGPAIEVDEAKVDKIFQVNVIGHINATKQLAPYVINAKGTIVFTSSVAARVPLAWTSVYSATKSAIDSYAQTLHGEMEPFGVRVHSIITGGVNTEIGDRENAIEYQNTFKNSLFNVDGAIESAIAAKRMSEDNGVSPGKYAKDVVGKIVRNSKKFNLYAGTSGYTLHFVSRYLPLWFVEFAMQWFFKQLKVFRNIRKYTK